jgi:hypothetical protein
MFSVWDRKESFLIKYLDRVNDLKFWEGFQECRNEPTLMKRKEIIRWIPVVEIWYCGTT